MCLRLCTFFIEGNNNLHWLHHSLREQICKHKHITYTVDTWKPMNSPTNNSSGNIAVSNCCTVSKLPHLDIDARAPHISDLVPLSFAIPHLLTEPTTHPPSPTLLPPTLR